MRAGRPAKQVFLRLPPGIRQRVLHLFGRYAPWEEGFDFSPPPLLPGETGGPPDFVGIGVQKAGTTWWYRLITAHPHVDSRPGIHKERHYLDRYGAAPFTAAEVDRYHAWFPRRSPALAGEWTPDYFALPWAPALLRQAAPHARLLLLLRDPIERLQSGLAHQRRMGGSRGATALADAVQRGFYHRALDDWLECFGPEQMLVLQYEKCAADPVSQLRATFAFLGLEPFDLPDGGELRVAPAAAGSGLDPQVTKRLTDLYQPDVLALARQVPHLDLSLWPNFSYLVGDASRAGDGYSPTSRE